MVRIDIITCPVWNARAPRQGIETVPMAKRIVMHHTAGHHPEISVPASESREESIAYAREIQAFHMDVKGWIDSGHNFLVCRNGLILQGRWLTVSAIQAGHMVRSAHCPGQNDQIGIEHEHKGYERMTDPQVRSSARLIAWVSWRYGESFPLPLHPHSEYVNTTCPANVAIELPRIFSLAQDILKGV